MRGEFIAVWQESFSAIWEELNASTKSKDCIFADLYSDFSKSLKSPPTSTELADIVSDRSRSLKSFSDIKSQDFKSESELVKAFERTYETLGENTDNDVQGAYVSLLGQYINKFNLRYIIHKPCLIAPSIVGLFSGLVIELKEKTTLDSDVQRAIHAIEECLLDLCKGRTDTRISTAIQKCMNLLEALGETHPSTQRKANGNTLGSICDSLTTWPHDSVRDALKNLYKFSNNHSGIRHGSSGASLRAINERDMIAVIVVLIAFSPYLTDKICPKSAFLRGAL